ncbi:MAG: hypothetical protein R2822_11510 [Spirosomataceae bacterium]
MRLFLYILIVGFFKSYAQENPIKPTPYAVSKHPLTFSGRQMIVGQTIGGLEKEYRLLDDGGIYRRMNIAKEFEVLGEQSEKNIETAFKSLKDIGFDKIDFQHKSKTSYFIIYKIGKKEHKVIWGDPNHPAPEGAVKVYKAFMGMIPPSMRL